MESTSPFAFLRVLEALKNIQRKGWAKRGIQSPESVSDHMYRMAVMVWMIPEIDNEIRMRAVKMALAHDMGEAIVGDITPSDGVPRDEKLLKERLALAYLACLIRPVNPSFADEIEELWSEFEAGDSKTAQLVRSVDALECMHQAVVYEERSQLVKDLGEFMELETKVSASELRDWAKCLKQERDTLWSSNVTQDLTFLFILGGPGVGKGTQCARITQDTSSVHISVGDLLREETKSTSSGFADFIKDSIRNSVIIPADFSVRLIQKRIEESQMETKSIVILDGFPRSLDQARAFEEKVIRGRFFTILLKCSEEVQLYRLNRRSESSGRIDDNDDSIKKRLRTFSQENLKIEKHLQSKGPFWTIDANGSADDVYASIKVVVDEITKDASQ
ncbi:hypothetical protein HRR83_002577 [Exophiala dermatitidis]|nr:hypothetical protein HRR73_005518 [Exophiala dermatitidis]KAJ4519919.1 hypothetical protein HRR75_001780 [Exophiala dermatitidis]KAJ4523743.1 hypothetical protein HRR74_001936 [Exophiala dermatitidis]KAJ4537320.1 hypothetical protein HRR76_005331 [Exophiala dermatitidis]KAJ4578680.1 hypothetical protein HRR81_002828 [Exophiala dermatitidis]